MESVLKRMAVSGCLSDEENKIGERPGRVFYPGCSPRVLRGNEVLRLVYVRYDRQSAGNP